MASSAFDVIDYIVVVIILGFSFAIGVYFGCFGSKQKSATEYMFGKGKRRIIPIGLSIYSSCVSALFIVAAPIEIYSFGTQFMMIYLGPILSLLISWTLVLPVFCGKLQLSTPYEYFELRFNYRVRVIITAIHTLYGIFGGLPVVLYSATAVFSEVTNIPLRYCTSVIGGICIIYTMLGGFSAVIWSDTFQATLMLLSCIFVMLKAIANVGGFSEMWTRADQGGRINFFDMDPNPFRRLTFWSAVIGMTFQYSGSSSCAAGGIQKYIALKKEKSARISTAMGSILVSIFGTINCITGIAMYANYYNCDPIKNQEVRSPNKLFPYFISNLVQDVPGFLGIFNVGLLSAGLSSLSSELNTVSGLIYHCFVKKIWVKTNNEKQGAIIMKVLVIFCGCICLIIAPLLDNAKYILSFILGFSGLTYGAKIGLLLLGTAFPTTNSLGAACGIFAGIFFLGWIKISSMFYDIVSSDILPTSIENCTKSFNTSSFVFKKLIKQEAPVIFKLSFIYYATFGTIITILVALIVSYFTGMNNGKEMDPNLFIPCVRPKKNKMNIMLDSELKLEQKLFTNDDRESI